MSIGSNHKTFGIIRKYLIEHHVNVIIGLKTKRKEPQDTFEYQIEFVVEFGELGDYVKNVLASIQWPSGYF